MSVELNQEFMDEDFHEPIPARLTDEEYEDIRAFFENSEHWAYQYGSPSESTTDSPYYRRQVQVILEGRYFHWVTNYALTRLVDEGFLKEDLNTIGGVTIKFIHKRKVRNVKREIRRRVGLWELISNETMSKATGDHAELLTENMLLGCQFTIVQKHTNEFRGRIWTTTAHNLDFIVEKEGESYGIEVKNTFPYMPREEFAIKVEMCQYLGIHPLFILRAAPYPQFEQMKGVGGRVVMFKTKVFPFGQQTLVSEIWRHMRLPVAVRSSFPLAVINQVKRIGARPLDNKF